ncbi:hypothetical protein E2C01_075099 [Portunus trituberculatus]|uniref:Uncharacterized protein n=1 Tax=Portunus trituberculatus TaxID=210409 RepID=A0A5B7IFA2_PORTR|nr:hypothetical protein [Portunus trituberculatus]
MSKPYRVRDVRFCREGRGKTISVLLCRGELNCLLRTEGKL